MYKTLNHKVAQQTTVLNAGECYALNLLPTSPDIGLPSDSGILDDRFLYAERKIERIFDFMCANYERHISLTEVAALSNMSVVYFSRFFKKMTGKTFIESLNEIRLNHACRMLAETNLNVAGIAYKCGFNNISNFNRVFKRKKLCVPKKFRDNGTC